MEIYILEIKNDFYFKFCKFKMKRCRSLQLDESIKKSLKLKIKIPKSEKVEISKQILSKKVVAITFDKTIDSLKELIELSNQYDENVEYDCVIDMKRLSGIVNELKELDKLIGLTKFKRSVIDQLLYILTTDFSVNDEFPMLHTVLYASPGLGKTTCAQILGKIYAGCGLLSKGECILAKREDFIGPHLGTTTIKTAALLKSCIGNVLFIDEVYALGSGNSSHRDSFSKEAIDCLNAFLSENYKDFICIVAGYKEEVENCFFSLNPGLKRRFTHSYTIDSYNAEEMSDIFAKFATDQGYVLECNLKSFFSENISSFPCYAGDVKTFLDKCKIVNARRKILVDPCLWCILSQSDIVDGFNLFLSERNFFPENLSYLKMYI